MSYLPKSKISILEASRSDEFATLSSNKPYVGPYIETSDGKYFAGNNIINRGEELILSQGKLSNFGNSKDFINYNKIKKSPYNFLIKTKPIPSSKNIPTEKDYKRGYYNRYFSSRVNHQFGYQEISLKTYKSINSESEKYDHFLYDVGLIKWALSRNVHQINQSNLTTLERTFPFISNLFSILNEFHRPNLQVQLNLNTDGDELYFKDGTEYIGDYHIHPIEGPMVGALHTQSSHPKLYYSNQISLSADRNDTTDEDFEKYLEEERKKEKRRWKKNLMNNKNQALKSDNITRGGTQSPTVSRGGGTSEASRGGTSGASRGGTSGTSGTSGGGRGGY